MNHINIKKVFFTAMLFAFAFVQSASAATLYSQAVMSGSSAVTSQGAIGGSDADVFTFATFTATQTGTVDNISWEGTSNTIPAYAGFSDGFTIDVLSGGTIPLPGSVAYAPISHTSITGAAGLANATLVANGMYDYNTAVQPFYIQAGTTYHISIRENGIAPWGWATAPGTGTIAYVAGVFKFLPSPGLPIFALNNVNNTVVAPPLVNPTAVTIVPVPAPVPTIVAGATGEVQGMVTSVGNGFITTDTVINGLYGALVTYDGDTVTTYHGGLVTFAVGEIVNYSYTVDVDGIILAKTVDVYPTEVVNGVGRVSSYTSVNGNNGLALTTGEVLQGSAVPYINFYNASSYNQIISYSGFRNPTTGLVYVTSAQVSPLPIKFKPVLPAATAGQMFSQNVMDFSLFGQPTNFGSITATGLPAGLTINGELITGIPTTAGTYTVSLTAYGDMMLTYAQLGTGTTTIVVNPASTTTPIVVATPVTFIPSLTNGQVGSSYTATNLLATGLAPFTVTATGTPTGMTVSSAGVLSGTPSVAGTYTITLSATSSEGATATGALTITIDAAPVVPIGITLPNGQVGVAYTATSLASVATSMYMVSNGSVTGVPAGMTVSVTGILSGTPTTAGTYQIGFYAIGTGLRLLGNATSTITIDPGVVVLPPADSIAPVIAMNGTDVTLTVGSSYVDAGATCTDNVDPTCSVITTNTVNTAIAGTYTVTYTAIDAAGNVAIPVVRTITVNPIPVIVTTTGAGVITSVGRNFIVINGGLNASDHVFYTPTAAGTTFFGGTTIFTTGEYVTFTGTVDPIGSVQATTMSVYPAVTFVTTLANAQATIAYASTNLLVSGTAPVVVIATGTPTGMTVSSAGVLSGTPSVAGTYTITLSATDSIGNTGTGVVILVVIAAPVIPVTFIGSLTNAQATITYTSVNLMSTGVAPYTVTATGVPAGMIISSTGDLSGTPTIAGTYLMTLTATDSVGTVGTGSATLTVTNAPIIITPIPTTYTSTGVKVDAKGVIASYDSGLKIVTLSNNIILRIVPTTKITLNDRATLSSIGKKIQYKGTKNTDGSVSLSYIEVN